MKLIVVTSTKFFVEENSIIDALFEEGVDYLHIRKPDSDIEFCERLVKLINKKWYKKIIMNDHFKLKEEYGLKGIHVSDRTPDLPKGYNGFYTRSCTTFEEIDYWKKRAGYVVTLGMDDEEKAHRFELAGVIDKNVIADQVRSVDDVRKFRSMGFGGVVLDDLLWGQFDFHQTANYSNLIKTFKDIRKAI